MIGITTSCAGISGFVLSWRPYGRRGVRRPDRHFRRRAESACFDRPDTTILKVGSDKWHTILPRNTCLRPAPTSRPTREPWRHRSTANDPARKTRRLTRWEHRLLCHRDDGEDVLLPKSLAFGFLFCLRLLSSCLKLELWDLTRQCAAMFTDPYGCRISI